MTLPGPSRHLRAATAISLGIGALALGGCATLAPTLKTAAEGVRVTAITASGGDDRTAATRVAQGIAAGQAAVTIGCAMVSDAAEIALFDGLRDYCAARD